MIYLQKPQIFNPVYEVSSVFLEFDNKILLLKRAPNKLAPNKWGIPAGKIDQGEDAISAAVRELAEETGVSVLPEDLTFVKTVYVKFTEYDFIFHMFHTDLKSLPEILLNPNEHIDYKWCIPKEALTLDSVEDLDACIKLRYRL